MIIRLFPNCMAFIPSWGREQGLRTRISRLGALGKLGLPLLYSQAGQESNAFCSIDRQDHTTSFRDVRAMTVSLDTSSSPTLHDPASLLNYFTELVDPRREF